MKLLMFSYHSFSSKSVISTEGIEATLKQVLVNMNKFVFKYKHSCIHVGMLGVFVWCHLDTEKWKLKPGHLLHHRK